MNTTGLEWFGPPERNTYLHCVLYCLCSQEIENEIVRSESELVLCLPELVCKQGKELCLSLHV